MQYLTIWDVILAPLYLLILSSLAKRYRDKHYKRGNPLRKYFMAGLWVKFGGAIFIALIYQFYYSGGDTYNFFTHSRIINSALNDSIGTWFDLMVHRPVSSNPKLYPYVSQMYWYMDKSSYTVARIGALFGLLNGTTYIPMALLFAYFSYTGIWAMYRTFVNLYPAYHKQLAYAFLFVPSTFVWGSAMFKDTVCMFGLGWMTFTTFRIFINKDYSFRNLFLLSISFLLIASVKVYIVLAFAPAVGLWLLMTYSRRIKTVSVRWVVNIFAVGIIAAGFLFFSRQFSAQLNKYSLDNIVRTAQITRNWIAHVSEANEGSAYSLGDIDPSLVGMLKKFPAAVNVTLFRPYVWESKKPIILLSAAESLTFLILALSTLFRVGPVNMVKYVFNDPNLSFFFIYSIIFAFAVGISTLNFGSLSRYKIPCMPFFAGLLLILYEMGKKYKIKKVNVQVQNENRPVYHLT